MASHNMIRKRIWMPGDSLPTYATHLTSASSPSMTLSVVNGSINVSAVMPTLGNAYIYKDLSSITDYVVQTGDYLEYDIIWDGDVRIAIDLIATVGGSLRDAAGAVDKDQNNLDSHSNTDLSAYANGKWYRRKIPITTLSAGNSVGKTIDFFDIVCEKDTAGTYVARLTNIAITDGKGAVVIPFA